MHLEGGVHDEHAREVGGEQPELLGLRRLSQEHAALGASRRTSGRTPPVGIGGLAVRPQAVVLWPLACDGADEGEQDQDDQSVRDEDGAPAEGPLERGVEDDERRAEDGAHHREPRGEAALAPEPSGDDDRPGDRVAEPGGADRDDEDRGVEARDAVDEAEADESEPGDDRAGEDQPARADPVEQEADEGADDAGLELAQGHRAADHGAVPSEVALDGQDERVEPLEVRRGEDGVGERAGGDDVPAEEDPGPSRSGPRGGDGVQAVSTGGGCRRIGGW